VQQHGCRAPFRRYIGLTPTSRLVPISEQLTAALAGRYTIERRVGEGGMATVYLARDVRHNRRVALKVLKPDLAAVVGVERFLAEIETTANLQHPHLLPLFDSGVADGLLFYVMPFVDGESLRARLDRERQLPVDEAVRIAVAIAGALDSAHRQGVIHRDLKPENILLQDGQPLVADFGIALALSNAGGQRMTLTGLSLGTPHYMSPEQATGDRVIDARTDVYSLGALTYEMLTGEPPHLGNSAQAIIARVLTEVPRRVRVSRPGVPLAVDAAVARAMEKLPADRFATAKDFATALRAETATVSVVASAERSARRVSLREAALAVIAIGASVTAIWLGTRPEPALIAGKFPIALPDGVDLQIESVYTRPRVAVSPDGRDVVLVLPRTSAHSALFHRRLDNDITRLIEGTEQGAYPSFSPNGRDLIFWRNGDLRRIALTGGSSQLVADSADPAPASWGDKQQILFARASAIWLVSANGGVPSRVAGPDSARGIVAFTLPSMLPGGTHALVTVYRGNMARESATLGVIRLRDGSLEQLAVRGTQPMYSEGHVLYESAPRILSAVPFSLRSRTTTGEPRQIFDRVASQSTGRFDAAVARDAGTVLMWQYGGASSGQSRVVVVDRSGREIPSLPDTAEFQGPRIAPDGRRMVVRIGGGAGNGNLWLFDLVAGTRLKLTNSRTWRPSWSGDGTRLTFLSGPDLGSQLVELPADGSGGERVVLTATSTGPRAQMQEFARGLPGAWSALRVGSRATSQNADIWIAPTDSLDKLRPFLTSSSIEIEPVLAPNSPVLAFTSNETGINEVYLTSLPGPGPRVPVSRGGGTEPVWSRDGRVLYYRSPTHMMAATVTTRAELKVTRVDTLFADHYQRYAGFPAYDVFPDGKRFLMISAPPADPRDAMQVIVNWTKFRVRGAGSADNADR